MEIDGLEPGKDFKVWPGGGRPWDWGEAGTRHDPGILPGDVRELLDNGVTTVVLSRGMESRLGVDPATRELLERHGIVVHEAETTEAVRIYNELVGAEAVGGLFHSTC